MLLWRMRCLVWLGNDSNLRLDSGRGQTPGLVVLEAQKSLTGVVAGFCWSISLILTVKPDSRVLKDDGN